MTHSITCPNCGSRYVEEVAVKKQKRRASRRYDSGATQAFNHAAAPAYPQRQNDVTYTDRVEPGTTHETTHTRPETPTDVATMALKAAGCGVAAMLVSIPLTVAFEWLPWYAPLLTFPGVAGLSWFPISGKAQGLVTLTEKLTRLDLNRDGRAGDERPQKQQRTVEVIVKADTPARHDKRAEFADDTKFHNLAHNLIQGAPATESTAKKCGLSRARWVEVRDLLLDRQWATWKDGGNHRAGIELRRAGIAALKASLPYPVEPSI